MTELLIPTVALGAASEVAVGVEQGARYELVGPDGSRAVFNDRTDVDFVGFLTAPPGGLDSAEVRESADLLVEADGGIHGAFYFGRRPFTLTGLIDPTPDASRDYVESETLLATNLITNPSFEVDLAGWRENETNSAAQLTREQLSVTQGAWAARINRTSGTGTVFPGFRLFPRIDVVPGQRYRVRADVDVATFPTGATGTTMLVRYYDAADVGLGTQYDSSSVISGTTTGAKLFNFDAVAPAGAYRAEVIIFVQSTASSAVGMRLDGVAVYAGATDYGYFDGATHGPSGFPRRTRWLGAEHASASSLFDVTRRPMEPGEVSNKRINRLQRVTRAMAADAVLRWQAANGPAVQLAGRRQQPLRITDRHPKRFLAALVAADPRIVRQAVGVASRATIINTDNNTALSIRNEGNAPASPTITIRATGAVTTPIRLINRATGGTIELALSLAANDVLVVDHRARTITLNGTNRYDVLNFAASSWWDLEPGENPVSVTVGANPANATYEVAWRDSWL